MEEQTNKGGDMTRRLIPALTGFERGRSLEGLTRRKEVTTMKKVKMWMWAYNKRQKMWMWMYKAL